MADSGQSEVEKECSTRQRVQGRLLRPALLLAAAHAALILAYAIGNPPWAAPDEPAQHTKALALAGGQLGRVPHYSYPPFNYIEGWYRRQTRVVQVPSQLAPPVALPCFAFHSERSAACTGGAARLGPWALDAAGRRQQQVDTPAKLLSRLDLVAGREGLEIRTTTYQGVYPPLAVLVPGFAARAGSSPESSLLFGRLAAAATAIALFTAGTLLLASGQGLRLLGPLLAVTPMAAFLGGMLNPSGTEIAGGYALLASLASLDRISAAWAIGLVGAAALVVSRPLGPVLLLLIAIAFALMIGRRRLAQLAGQRPRWAAAAAVPVGLLVCVSVWWGAFVLPRPPDPGGTLANRVTGTSGDLGEIARETVGVLGWLDVPLPAAVYWAWAASLGVVVALALRVGTRRQRLALIAAIIGVGAATFLLSVVFAYSQSTRVQGRWILPVAMGVPLLAVEVLARRPRTLTPSAQRRLLALVGAAVAASQLSALWANSRRYAVGVNGPIQFLTDGEWAPGVGWVPVLSLGVTACLAILVTSLSARKAPPIGLPLSSPSSNRSNRGLDASQSAGSPPAD